MAKFLFISIYNEVALGPRLLGSILEENGHSVEIVFFKKGKTCESFSAPTTAIAPPVTDHRSNDQYSRSLQGTRLMTYNHECDPVSDVETKLLMQRIADSKPDIVGISATSYFEEQSVELLADIKKAHPGMCVVAGGYGPTFNPEAYVETCDYVFFGEGEKSVLEFVDRFDAGKDLSETSNLIFKRGDKIVRNPLAPVVADLDELPFPLFRKGSMWSIDEMQLRQEDPIGKSYFTLVGRGCPGTCTYCCTAVIGGLYKSLGQPFPGRRYKTIDGILKELKQAVDAGFDYIIFEDSYLVGKVSFLLELFARYKKTIGLPFFAYLHYPQVVNNPEIFDAALDAGLNHTVCGIQHAGEEFANKTMGRNVSSQSIKYVSQKLIDAGILYNYDFISDIPIETEEDFNAQLDAIPSYPFSTAYTRVGISKLRSFPGTPLTAMIEKAAETTSPTEWSKVPWLYKSLLIVSRFLLNDEEFSLVRNSEFFREKPDALLALLPRFWAQKCVELGETCLEDSVDITKIVYQIYADRLFRQEIIIWGTGSRWVELSRFFNKNIIAAFIDNDPAKQGTEINGVKVHGPDFLKKNKDRPVFICSVWKKEIFNQIRQDYGDEIVIP